MTCGWCKLAPCLRAVDVRLTRRRVIQMTDGLGNLRGRLRQTSTPLWARWPLQHPAVTSRSLRRIARIVYFHSSVLPCRVTTGHCRNPPPATATARVSSVICSGASVSRRPRLLSRIDPSVANRLHDSVCTLSSLHTLSCSFVSQLVLKIL